MNKLKNTLATAIAVITLAGCSVGPDGSFNASTSGNADNKGTPGVIVQPATISGLVDLGPVRDIEVTAYQLDDLGNKTVVGRALASDGGFYSIPVVEKSGLIYLSASSGQYQESSSQEWVYIPNSYELKNVVNFENGVDTVANLNIYTTIAIGKLEHLTSIGRSVENTVDFAKSSVSAYLGADQDTINPIYPFQDDAAGLNVDSEELMTGMRTSVTSDLIGKVNTDNGFPEHSIFTTIKFLNLAYDDVRYDGYLNGYGYRGEGDQAGNLSFGLAQVNEDFYRLEIARQTIQFLSSDRNKSDIEFLDYRDEANKISSFKGNLFENVAGEAIDPENPSGSWNVSANEVLHGDKKFILNASDNVQVDYVELQIGDTVITRIDEPDLKNHEYIWDSAEYPDGIIPLTYRVVDLLGNITELTEQVFVQNVHYFPDVIPVLSQTSVTYVGEENYLFTGHYEDYGAGLQSLTVNGFDAPVDENGNFEFFTVLKDGQNDFEVYAQTQFLRENTANYQVFLDKIDPVISMQTPNSSYTTYYEKGSSTTNLALEVMSLSDTDRVIGIKDSHVSLNGLPQTAADLAGENRAFFHFQATDTDGSTDTSSKLTVNARYLIDGVERMNRNLISIGGNEYILPIAQEGLGLDFYKVTPNAIHQIEFTATDGVGNTAQENARFKLAVSATDVAVDTLYIDSNSDILNLDFENRSDLLEAYASSIVFEVDNNSDLDMWVAPERTGTRYQITQYYSRHIKEHKVNRTVRTQLYAPSAADQNMTTPIDGFYTMNGGSSIVETDTGFGLWAGLANDKASCLAQLVSDGFTYHETDNVGVTTEEVILTDTLKNNEVSEYQAIPGFSGNPSAVTERVGAAATGQSLDILIADNITQETYFTPSYGVYCTAPETDWRYRSDSIPNNDIVLTGISSYGVAQKTTTTETSVPGWPRMNESAQSSVYYNLPTVFSAENQDGSSPQQVGAWVKIPANSTSLIRLEVFTPAVNIKDDPYISDYFEQESDQKFTYEIDSSSFFRFTPDNGEDNIATLPETLISVDDGIKVLEIQR